jgi:DNA ligase 1
MYSRNGNRFYFPKFFTKNWPNSQLDGELFIGRGLFSKTISAVKKNTPIDSEWENVRYLVFDCPGLKKPFKTRIKMMEEEIKALDNSYIKCHAHRKCESYEDLFKELDEVNKIEGEGLMLRDPESYYENRRSKTLLKVKTFHDDEATVLGYTEGTGRCYGMVGALKCRNTHGV